MSMVQFIVAFGVGAGLLAILVVVVFERLRKRQDGKNTATYVPKTFLGGLGIGGLTAPAAMIARSGQQEPARMSLNTVVMTPTRGLRLISLGGSALILVLLWSPYMTAQYDSGLTLYFLVTALLGYGAIYIAGYEVRYDADGITAPNWLFQDKHYSWEEFIFIKDDGHYLYRLRFEHGTLAMQKYLVGMPTFLTFVSEIRKLNQRP